MHSAKVSDLVRKYYSDFVSRNRKAVEDLLSDAFTFSSPRDDHIGKKDYLERCWPNGDKFPAIQIVKLFEEGNEAFVLYECEMKDGAKFRNTEFLKLEGNRIKEVNVYFGRSL